MASYMLYSNNSYLWSDSQLMANSTQQYLKRASFLVPMLFAGRPQVVVTVAGRGGPGSTPGSPMVPYGVSISETGGNTKVTVGAISVDRDQNTTGHPLVDVTNLKFYCDVVVVGTPRIVLKGPRAGIPNIGGPLVFPDVPGGGAKRKPERKRG